MKVGRRQTALLHHGHCVFEARNLLVHVWRIDNLG